MKIVFIYLYLFFSQVLIAAEELENLEFVLGFWPEYDRKETLVMVQVNAPDKFLPFNSNINIPNSVDSIYILNDIGNAKNLIPVNLETKGKWNIQMDDTNYYIQFYIPFKKQENRRTVKYDFNLDISLDQFHVVIQEPLKAENFNSNLENYEIITDEFGLKYHRSHFKEYESGTDVFIQFEYLRNSNKTTMDLLQEIVDSHSEFLKPESIDPEENNTVSKVNYIEKTKFDLSIKYSILFTLLAFICISIFYYFFGIKSNEIVDENFYCPFCGINIKKNPKQNFCIKCGGKLDVS